MNTLTLNPGSRWLKCALYSEDGEEVSSDKIAIDDKDTQTKWFATLSDVGRIGVRIVHGGGLESPAPFTAEVGKTIKQFAPYAPLHNPVALKVLEHVQKQFKDVPVYCVFDTHFHRTLPPESYTYSLPCKVAERHKLRRYGFHGIALESVFAQFKESCAKRGIPVPKKIIMAHLGGGSSVTAVEEGRSVSTSMGVTPLEGAVMISRSGSIDPDIVRLLVESKEYTLKQASELLNTSSGLMGLAGHDDTKQLIDDAVVGKQPAALAYKVYLRSIIAEIYRCYAVLQGADALIFSGGIGFRNIYIRPDILKETKLIGLTKENTHAFQADETRAIFNYRT